MLIKFVLFMIIMVLDMYWGAVKGPDLLKPKKLHTLASSYKTQNTERHFTARNHRGYLVHVQAVTDAQSNFRTKICLTKQLRMTTDTSDRQSLTYMYSRDRENLHFGLMKKPTISK